MPRYKGVLSLEDNGPDTPIVHLFDYSTEEGKNDSTTKSNYKKQVIALESCIYLGRRNLASIKASQSKHRSRSSKSESTNDKTGTRDEKSQPSTNQSKPRSKSENKENKEMTNGKTGRDAQPLPSQSKSRNNSENKENNELTNEKGAKAKFQPSTTQSKSRNNSENNENSELTNEKGAKAKSHPSSIQSKSRNNSENNENKELTNEKGAKAKSQPSSIQSKSRNNSENNENKELTNEKGAKAKSQPSSIQSKSRNNSENNENKELANREGAEAVLPDKKKENATEEKEVNKGDSKDVKTKENVKKYIKEGQEFQAYILKCPNGPYDYAMKLWDTGRAAPSEAWYPKEGEEVGGVVVDRSEDFLTVACGPNIAFARRKNFLCAGVDPDDLSLPFARLKVSLRRLQEREAQVPAAGWEATPTQVVVTPYDIY